MFPIDLPASGIQAEVLLFPFMGFVVGLFSGLLGLGGGWLITPALNVIGLPAAYAVGTSLTQMVATTATGAIKHWRMGNVILPVALVMTPLVVIGTYIGKALMQRLELLGYAETAIGTLHLGLSGIITFVVLRDVLQPEKRSKDSPQPEKANNRSPEQKQARGGDSDGNRQDEGTGDTSVAKSKSLPNFGPQFRHKNLSIPWYALVFFPLISGTAAGIMGIGGGLILIPVLVYLFGLPMVNAVATNLTCVVFGSLNGAFIYAYHGQVEFLVAGLVLTGSLLGSWLGASLTGAINDRKLRIMFSVLLVSTGSALVLRMLDFHSMAQGLIFSSAGLMTVAVLVMAFANRQVALKGPSA